MNSVKLLILVWFLGLAALRPSYGVQCPGLLDSEPNEAASSEGAGNSVELLWYPKAGYFFITHVELAVNGVAWGASSGFKPKVPLEVAERAAQGKTGKGFFRFQFDLSAEEIEALEAFLQDRKDKLRLQTCIEGICFALRKTTRVKIPFPFSQVPTATAAYLVVGHSIGWSRVAKIEYTGSGAVRSLIATEIPSEIAIAYGLSNLFGGHLMDIGQKLRQILAILLGA